LHGYVGLAFMNNLPDWLLIALKWLLSYLRKDWELNDYPIRLRAQHNVPDEIAWHARVLNWLGPTGLGSTQEQALSDLHANLRLAREERARNNQAMPRPGEKVPLQFASAVSVDADPALLDDFIENILGISPSGIFISDLSSLGDFGIVEDVEVLKQRIFDRYEIEITEPETVLVADILERVRASRRG
jgi:hypothetical protein